MGALLIAFFLIFLLAILVVVAIDVLLVLFGTERRSPFVPTSRKHFDTIFKTLAAAEGTLYDLGCGDGAFLLFCAQRAPKLRCIGIERNLLLFAFARLRALSHGRPKNLHYAYGNFFERELSDATHVFAYLLPSVLSLLEEKLEREAPKARIVTRAFKMKTRTPREIVTIGEGSGKQLLVYQR